jgi:hypothetical protein
MGSKLKRRSDSKTVAASPSYRWAERCVLSLVAGGLGGFLAFFAEDTFGLAVNQFVVTGIVASLVASATYSLLRMYTSLRSDPVLSVSTRAHYRRRILLVGPVAAVEMVLSERVFASRDKR